MYKRHIFARNFHEYSGILHVHTQYSHDCDVPMLQVLRAARRARLDFLGITDHYNRGAATDPNVLAEERPLVMVGCEVNDPLTDNHYLVFGSEEIITGRQAEEYVRHYHEQGAVGFMAHPRERRISFRYPIYPWTADLMPEVDGIEIWNYISSWLGSLSQKLNGLPLVLFPIFFVRRPLRENLGLWDEMNRRGWRKAAIGSVDAHGHRYTLFGLRFRILLHRYLFNTIRTNVLLPADEPLSQEGVLRALRMGNSYVVNYQMGCPFNFWAAIKSPNGGSACFGEEIPYAPGMRLYYNLPTRAAVNLFRDGMRVARQRAWNGWFELDRPGAYRLEIRRWVYGWIYTNNIWVTPAQ